MNAAEQQGHLEPRLAILERRVRRYQRLGLMLGLGLVLAVSLAARQPPGPPGAPGVARERRARPAAAGC